MSIHKQRWTVTDIEAQREKMLALAALQRKLRAGLLAVKEKLGCTIQEIATASGTQWSRVRDTLEARSAVRGGETLTLLAQFLAGYESDSGIGTDFETQVKSASEDLSDRVCGAAMFADETINLMYRVHIALVRDADGFDHTRFAALFGEHAATIQGLLLYRRDGLEAVENDEAARASINATLDADNFTARIAEARSAHEREVAECATKFKSIADELRKRYASVAAICEDLGIHESSFHEAQRGTAYLSTIKAAITRGQELLEKPAPAAAVPAPAPRRVAAPAHVATPQAPTLLSILEEAAKHCSALGVPFALTEASATPIDFDPGHETIALAKRTGLLMIGLLSTLARIKDDNTRATVRAQLEPIVVELDQTIRIFNTTHPTRLISIYTAQRDTLAHEPVPSHTSRRR